MGGFLITQIFQGSYMALKKPHLDSSVGQVWGGGFTGRKAHEPPAVVVVVESRRVLLALIVCSWSLQSCCVFLPEKTCPACGYTVCRSVRSLPSSK